MWMRITMSQKRCTRCGLDLPATTEHFPRDAQKRDGLYSVCKTCCRADHQRYRTENPDKVRERHRRYRAENPDKKRESNRRWNAANPDKTAVNSRNHQSRKRAAEGTHTAADVAAQLKRQKSRCYYCGCKMTATPHLPNSQTVEHVVPVTRGGRNAP